ncbi:ARM repeat-containing protein [Thozetella sp. PMI_491]|nr:ARM repeat-containing protein [Thozetella sp. PMI_491]
MSAAASTGSPSQRRSSASRSYSQDENSKLPDDVAAQIMHPAAAPLKKSTAALTTSKLANQSCPKKLKTSHDPASTESYPMDKLLAKLSEHPSGRSEKADGSDPNSRYRCHLEHQSSSSSLPVTPADDALPATAPTTRSASMTPNDPQASDEEVLRLKFELARAQSKIERLDQELVQTRLVSQISGRGTPAIGADLDISNKPESPAPVRGQNPVYQPGLKAPVVRDSAWMQQEDGRSDVSDPASSGGLGRARGGWSNKNASQSNYPHGPMAMDGPHPAQWSNNGRTQGYGESGYVSPALEGYRQDRMTPDHEAMRPTTGRRGNRFDNRFSNNNYGGGYSGYCMGPTQYDAAPGFSNVNSAPIAGGIGMSMYAPYSQQPIGTPLSPHATEFTSAAPPWKTEPLNSEGQTYLPATEPLNYRRLLDRNVTCDWKYIVDKIVCNNDQQASIFLQQKLKVGTPEQKYDIVEAIVAQAYPLMVNRFGNFLVQRCFEHGTPEQVIKIAEAIRGNTLNLSMDPFGCHVVQKAFDSVPEDYKAIMVHELLRRIPETVIHRYACHVWQKLFELRWTESPPQIMKYVNEALRGMWHEVALGETGSLVVQNIFENCLEEDKRPCIEEVLANIDIVAHGQFGNWCIQHICEHGAPADRSRAIDHVIRYAAEYSMDQFASKVVEKCLKIGGSEFLGRYLDRVCEGRVDRPRIPLIDIASDQYGNYLVQYILTHANPQHREIVAAHIRKHMVSLRGSKFGSRVGMLCTNHAAATRPGPGVGPAIGGSGNRIAPGARYGNAYR